VSVVLEDDGFDIWRSGRVVHENVRPVAPAIVLLVPKYPHNVGQIVRLASCYGIPQVWYSGQRLNARIGGRLPREERMKRYQDVTLINHPDPLTPLLDAVPNACPVAVELRPGSELLPKFVHPDNEDVPTMFKNPQPPIYVFGPEDGSVPGQVLKRCHRFVVIPSYECFNLATAVAQVLYDRMAKMPVEQWPSVRERGMVA
jgi:tRNA(Leu) C34 or U34 (ribose-2'-O)-methylase TrmL